MSLITQTPRTGKATNNKTYPELTEISDIKCFYRNADQLRNKQNDFEQRIRDLKPNIIVINEVKNKKPKVSSYYPRDLARGI